MRIAVLADIHANLAALHTVIDHVDAWKPDHVIVAGDVVNRGPRPLECLRLIQEKEQQHGWLTVRGNHEDYVISQAQPDAPHSGPVADVHRASRWTYHQLQRDVSPLQSMPFQQDLLDPGGQLVRCVHASMLGNRVGIYPENSDLEIANKAGLPIEADEPATARQPSLFCVGHTHRPLIRRITRSLVVNAGSAGLSFDGDQRAAYAQLTWQHGQWQARIVRLPFDLRAAEQDFYLSGYLEQAGPLVRLVLIELLSAQSMLFSWALQYQDAALAGRISVQQSVDDFMGI